jgi:hypothetical protein
MVRGISNTKYKHRKKNDEKYLTKDLQEIKKTVQNYIDEIRPDSINEKDYIVKTPNIKIFKYIISFLGIIGCIALITGIFSLINANYIGGVPLITFGIIFILIFVLNIRYSKS